MGFDQAQLDVIAQELIRQRRSLGVAENQARVGLVPSADLTQQRAAITTTEARVEPIRADLEVRAHALAILLNQQPTALVAELSAPPPLQPAPVVPAGLPADLLRRRPDIRAAERNLAASTADIGVAVADLYPRFSLTDVEQLISTSLRTLFTGDSLQLTGAAGLQLPLIAWGRRRATVHIREEDAQTQLLSAREQLAGSDAQLRQQTVALMKALGGGWESLPDSAPPLPKR